MSEVGVENTLEVEIYLSKEQLCKMCHIKKATAQWLIETGRIPAIKPEKKGLGYKIAKTDAERYLAERSINPKKYARQIHKHRNTYGRFKEYDAATARRMREIAKKKLARKRDLLVLPDICKFLGYNPKAVYELRYTKGLKAIKVQGKVYFPKECLLDFIASPEFFAVSMKSEKHIELIRSALYEG